MAITIRLPSDSTLPSYHYRPRSVPLHTRLYRRLIPLTILLVLVLETIRFLRTPTAPPATPTLPPTSLPDTPPGKGLNHLIIVAAHGIWDPSAGDNGGWIAVHPYQHGQESTWVQHVNRSVSLARADPSSLLVFSGGETKREAGPRSEAASYLDLARHHGFINGTDDPLWARATTETFALDSYQNLAFSTCRFREFAGAYPEKITVVGYGFKRERFERLHKVAMGWEGAWEYVGVDPEWDGMGEGEEKAAREGEARVRGEWERCEAVLEGKRRGRNWGGRAGAGGYAAVCPEMGAVWGGCGVGKVRWR